MHPVISVAHSHILIDDRRLEVISAGDPAAPAFVFHGGTPSVGTPYEPSVRAVLDHGFRWLSYSRPGYAGSDPASGRTVADAATDVAAILDECGADRFVTVGWSGGGPHALACAALLPERCVAAATIAGVAPYGVPFDWYAGMGPENVEEFSLAVAGDPGLSNWLDNEARDLASVSGEDVADALGGLISEVDRASLTGEFASWLAESIRAAVSSGIAGWRDDDLAFVSDWGFDLAGLTRPVFVWQGDEDRMVPFAHGEWLASSLPTAVPRLMRGEGHLSVAVAAFDRIVADLAGQLG